MLELVKVSRRAVNGGPSRWSLSFIYPKSELAKVLERKVKDEIKLGVRPPTLDITHLIKPELVEKSFCDASYLGENAELKLGSLYFPREGASYTKPGQSLFHALNVFNPDFMYDEGGFVRLVLNDFLKLE